MYIKNKKGKGQTSKRISGYSIGEVSNLVNLSQKTIRDYENLGLFKPKRQPKTNNRIYTEFEIEQIRHITYLIHNEGLTLSCIQRIVQLAPCWNIFGCEVKEDCPAYSNGHTPCYETRKDRGTLCAGACDHCVVYINRLSKKKKRVLPRPAVDEK